MKAIYSLLISTIFIFSCTVPPSENKLAPKKFIRTTTTYVKVPNYRNFKTFKNDTLSYIKYNFEQRKSYYTDRSLSALFKDLEIPIFQGLIREGKKYTGRHAPPSNDSVSHISLYLENDLTVYTKLNNRIKPNILIIKLKQFPADSAWMLSKKYYKAPSRWPQEIANYYANRRIEDIFLISK